MSNDPNKILFKCPTCGKTLSIQASMGGKVVVCPCGQRLTAPTAPAVQHPVQPIPMQPAQQQPFVPPQPLQSLPANQSPYAPPRSTVNSPKPKMKPKGAAGAQVQQVITGQKLILFGILIYILTIPLSVASNLSTVGPPDNPEFTIVTVVLGLAGLVMSLATIVLAITGIIKIGGVLFPGSTVVFYCIGLFLPCLGLIILLIVNGQATSYLQQRGYKVGLFGAKQ